MKNNSLTISIILYFFIAFILQSCVKAPEKIVISPPPKEAVPKPMAPVISKEAIEDGIQRINHILGNKNINSADRKIALDLLSAYKKIRSLSLGQHEKNNNMEIVRILLSNLRLLEEQYFSKEKKDTQVESRALISEMVLKKKGIMDAYLFGNYEEVIDKCLELESVFGPDSLSPDIGLVFSLSLAKKERFKEAVNIGEKIINELEGRPETMDLKAGIVDWQLKLGNKESATLAYERLMDDFDAKETLFTRSTGKISTSENIMTADKERSLTDILEGRDKPFPESLRVLFNDVEVLLEKKEFQEAKLHLIRYKIRLDEGPEREVLDLALKYIENKENRLSGAEQPVSFRKNEILRFSKKLIEEEEFEDAIERLQPLMNDPTKNYEAESLYAQAVEGIINLERNMAAKLFLKARTTNDSAKKKKLLTNSYKILISLIDNYPKSASINKLKDNARKVKEELIKLELNSG